MKTITWNRFERLFHIYEAQGKMYKRRETIVIIGEEKTVIDILDKTDEFFSFLNTLHDCPMVEQPRGYTIKPLQQVPATVNPKSKARFRAAATRRKAGKKLVKLMTSPSY